MKLILAVIQPTKLDAVQQALSRIGVTRMSVCDATGFARQRGQLEIYRGSEYQTNLLRKVQLEIAVNDDFVERTIECLEQVARTGTQGTIGDGKIFVLPMAEAVRVSDGQDWPRCDLDAETRVGQRRSNARLSGGSDLSTTC